MLSPGSGNSCLNMGPLHWEEAKLAGSSLAMNSPFVALHTAPEEARWMFVEATVRPSLLEQWAYYSWKRQFLCQISLCKRVYSLALQRFCFVGSFFTCCLRIEKEAAELPWKMSPQLLSLTRMELCCAQTSSMCESNWLASHSSLMC